MRVHATQLTRAWRQYCGLYPAELRAEMVAPMARLIATGTGTTEEIEALAAWTESGRERGHHEQFLAGIESCVKRLWGLRTDNTQPLEAELSALELNLAAFGVEVFEPTPFDGGGRQC